MASDVYEAAKAGGVVDTAVGLPKSREEMYKFYGFIRKQTRDSASQEGGELEFPAGYMFKDVPNRLEEDEFDPIAVTLAAMDKNGVAMGLVGFFAIFHGHAHGAEIPENAEGVVYAVGFMIATALLHLAGITAGFLIGRAGEHRGSLIVRFAGGLATMAGVGLLIGIL